MGCKMQLTFTKREIITSGKGRLIPASVCGKYLFPSSNAKRNIKEIAFLERLKGSNKLSTAGCQHFPPPAAAGPGGSSCRDATTKKCQEIQALKRFPQENKQRDSLCHPIPRRISAQPEATKPCSALVFYRHNPGVSTALALPQQ